MPRHLNFLSDNATKEGKNQVMMKWCCFAMASNKFDSVTFNTFRVGHSHNPIDQRLRTAATALSRAAVLQDADQFRERVRAHVEPIHNRVLHQEHLHTSYDWATLLNNLDINVPGHTGKGSAHVFNLVRRQDLFMDSIISQGVVSVEEQLPVYDPHPLDIMMVVKARLSSKHLSRLPFRCCPMITNAVC